MYGIVFSAGNVSACSVGGPGSIPRSGRFPGEGNGNPLQYSFLETLMDRGAWRLQSMGSQRVGRDLATKAPPPPDGPRGYHACVYAASVRLSY